MLTIANCESGGKLCEVTHLARKTCQIYYAKKYKINEMFLNTSTCTKTQTITKRPESGPFECNVGRSAVSCPGFSTVSKFMSSFASLLV